MKKSLLLLLAVGFVGCQQPSKPEYTILSGKTSGYEAKKINLFNGDRSISKSLDVNEDGTFRDTLILPSDFYHVYVGRSYVNLYLENGMDIDVTIFDSQSKKLPEITGVGIAVNQYLLERRRLEEELTEQGAEIYKLEETDFMAKFNQVITREQQLLDTISGLTGDFKEKEKRNIQYEYLMALKQYPSYHRYYAKDEDYQPSERLTGQIDQISLHEEVDYRFSNAYRELVSSKYATQAREEADDDVNVNRADRLLALLTEVPNEYIREKLIVRYGMSDMAKSDDLDAYYSKMAAALSNTEHLETAKVNYEKYKKIEKGVQSPEFTGYENHAGGSKSLSELKGEYVYIDVWATWCGPCKYEIPFLKTLEGDYHGKDIHFVSISIDEAKDHDKWVNMVNEKELGGIQLLADNAWKSKFVQDYYINGIPRFILLDKEGKILDSDAPRPSSKEIREIFDSLDI
ncbi:TlpA family protein disulfide reductase [Robertkochia solimangrovi]|uniref:TlpA family protein disulfide reductase n=1 Tax=Robertkochia solimangrovi TaxID=2213046 RepID=UPI00117D6214|nr:TlpA disulfide reductase family protein [Robertkochia solimangrovi]TRZ42143.1 TlpA family protein disulfide reductase [Robertkochia solimangrovi]